MSDSNYDRYRIVLANKKMLAVLAVVVLALIAGVLLYARDYSGNDTSSAVTNTPPARP
jgi:hypothetical protein